MPTPRFTAASWVAPAGLDPDVEAYLRAHVFGTLDDPREGPLRELTVWRVDDGHDIDARLASRARVGRVRHTAGEPPVAVVDGQLEPVESIGPELDLVRTCRAALATGREGPLLDRTPAALMALGERIAIRALCPRSAAAQLIHAGELELGTAVFRRSMDSTRVGGLSAAERAWMRTSGLIESTLDAMQLGDACLAGAIARQAVTALTAFEREPGAQAVCGELDCSAFGNPMRLVLGLERRATAAPTVTLPLSAIADSVTAENAAPLVRRLDEMTHAPYDASHLCALRELMEAIGRAGDLVVPALIARLEQPDALTQIRRENSYGCYFDVITVHDLVRTLLDEILVLGLSWSANDEESMLEAAPEHAAIYRARFAVVRGMSAAQRGLNLLRHSQDVTEWNAGATELHLQLWHAEERGPEAITTLRAETGAAARRLMVRRAFDALRLGETEGACDLAHSAKLWDPAAASSWATRFARACARIPECECSLLDEPTTGQ